MFTLLDPNDEEVGMKLDISDKEYDSLPIPLQNSYRLIREERGSMLDRYNHCQYGTEGCDQYKHDGICRCH